MLQALFTDRVLFMLLAWFTGVLLFWRLRTLDDEDTGGISLDGLKVSVIIPARNEEKNIPTLLDSLQNQTFGNFDVILVDDNSSDATRSIAHGYGVEVLHLEGDPPAEWDGAVTLKRCGMAIPGLPICGGLRVGALDFWGYSWIMSRGLSLWYLSSRAAALPAWNWHCWQ